MKTRALDSLNDWQFGRGIQSYKTEKDALMQNIFTRLRQWKRNCFFAMNDGVDYTNYLDIGTKAFLDMDIKRVILQTAGVLRISDYTSKLDSESREVAVDATIETVFGLIEIAGVV